MRRTDSLAGLRRLTNNRRAYLALGTFDGVHVGHQTILREMVFCARAAGAAGVVVTFEPHPLEVLGPHGGPPRLSTPEAKAAAIARLGVDCLVTLPFDEAFAAIPADSFVRDHLAAVEPLAIYVGYNFSFGQRGAGGPAALVRLGGELGFAVRVFRPLTAGGEPLSSTGVRDSLTRGAVAEASRLLGRPYRLLGRVAAGDRRGRQIGYPTANLAGLGRLAAPGPGVYAGWAVVGGGTYAAVVNSGCRPTFGLAAADRLEVHLIDFAGEIYDQILEIIFIEKLRAEQRFASAAELARQIGRDVARARGLLRAERPGVLQCTQCP